MVITRVKIKNWRNFKDADLRMAKTTYLIGPNASGKSNLLDLFRFLRDLCKPDGGGLQKAVKDRGGIRKLRCLHHRKDSEVRIELHFAETFDSSETLFIYVLGFKGRGAERLLITQESVHTGEKTLLMRPSPEERNDPEVLTQTHLEQTIANRQFRKIVECLSETTYLHLVPQLLKYGETIGGNRLEDDPFGQGFLERVARTTKRTRDARLKRISSALQVAVPRFSQLRFIQDELGHPHLEALYEHHRPGAGWQSEEQFSDGTLRLLALLWSLQDGKGLLLMEEPELSLHEAVVEQIPAMINSIQKSLKKSRQIIITTHSQPLLNNQGIDPEGILILQPSQEGTCVRGVNQDEQTALNVGLTVSDVVLPNTRPKGIEQLALGL